MLVSECFLTRCKNLEILFLLNGLKPVVRQGYYDKEIIDVEKFCIKNSLHLVKSTFKVKPTETEYSNKGILSSEGMTFVYISKDELLANESAYLELIGDHFSLGIRLGYPKCCALFFQREYPIRSKLDNNYDLPVIQNSKGRHFPYQTNIFRRYEDYCLLSHFPCCLSCEKSILLARSYEELLKSKSPGEFKAIKEALLEKYLDLSFY